ncbi:MAG: SusC/RagA family TonB-linked outer membrane protein [Alistipes finegoldii]
MVTAFTQQTGVVFSYETSLGERTLPHVDVALNGSTLDEMLASVFAGTGISYKIKDKVVALSAPPQSDAPAARSAAQQRKQTVAGRVTDEQGEPLAGVSVLVKNTLTGTSTDADGRYSLSVSGSGAVLVFMYLGFQTLEEEVGARSTLDVTLRENKQILEEVVVVGYGSVKRRDLIGAVDQVDSRQFAERSNPSVSRSLQGAIPNLNISMRDGKPSRAATIDIRGAGSIGSGGGALVLIDGVEGDLETVNPQDIASVSVLKDASSAAIYGARGAFGVILVTTKSASEGEVNVTYSGSFSIHSRTVKPNLVTDGYEWTTGYINAWNGYYNGSKELNSTINNIVPYSDSWYRELARRSTDPSLERVRINDNGKYEYFGNTDWTKAFYKDVNYSHEHNLSISGGGKNADYYVSGRFYDQDGIYRVGDERYKQYNVRAKGSVRIRPWLRLNNNMDFTVVDYHQPMLYYSNQLVPRMVEHSGQPVSLITNPDGTWTYAAVLNGYAGFAEGTSYQQEDKFTLKDKLGVEIDLVKDVLKVSGDLSYLFSRNTRERVTNMYTGYTGPESTITVNESQGSTLQNVRYDMNYVSSNIYAEYTPNWATTTRSNFWAAGISKEEIPHPDRQARGADRSFEAQFRADGRRDERPHGRRLRLELRRSLLPRQLRLQGRYLAEFSCRYDGSSKFPRIRSGASSLGFGGLAALRREVHGWSEGWLDNFKIRLSAGSMGNGNIDPYKYIDYMTSSPRPWSSAMRWEPTPSLRAPFRSRSRGRPRPRTTSAPIWTSSRTA